MAMQTKLFGGGRLRKAEYEPTSQQLQLHWEDGRVLAYGQVPAEVFRRLCSAPSPATYWEDRIAEEYPRGTPQPAAKGATGPAGKNWNDLFGEPDGS